jgi:hypothetical protein
VAEAEEEAGSSGIDGSGGYWQSRESVRQGLREFWDEKQNDTGHATIYRFKTIRIGSY